jgi:hypothetical protein
LPLLLSQCRKPHAWRKIFSRIIAGGYACWVVRKTSTQMWVGFSEQMNRACGRITGGPEELLRLFLRLVLGPCCRTSCSRSRCPKGLGTFEWLLAKHLVWELFLSVLNLYVLNDYRRALTAQRPRTTCTSTSGATSMTLPLAGTSPRWTACQPKFYLFQVVFCASIPSHSFCATETTPRQTFKHLTRAVHLLEWALNVVVLSHFNKTFLRTGCGPLLHWPLALRRRWWHLLSENSFK